MNEFDILQSAAAGMDAQRAALDVAARNVAAAEATPGASAFERMVPRFALANASRPDAALSGDAFYGGGLDGVGDGDGVGFGDGDSGETTLEGDDPADPPVRYLGAVPERGVDVDAVTEMVAVLDAQRAYESDASVFDAGKRLAERTIDMGRLQ
jgi:flagellar basal-body rod protein FlgC